MLRSLNTRLLFSYLVVILTCLMLVGLGLLLFLRNSPLWTTAAFLRLEAAARTTVLTVRQAGPLDTLPAEQLWALLKQAAEEQNVRVLLLDERGVARFDTEGTWMGEPLRDHLEQRPQQPIPRGGARGILMAPSGGRWAYFSQPIPGPNNTQHTILFTIPQTRLLMLAWFAENLLPPVIQAGAVALVLSILLALLISRSVTAPLHRVAGAAESIAQGETGTRAPVDGPTEVQALARSFNTMADQVEATHRSQRDFVANVSHELKTPLTSIQGFSQALLDGTASTPEISGRAARVIHQEAERMRRMVDELLTLARFDAGQIEMAHQPVELGSLLRGCVEKLTPLAQAADVTLALDAPSSLVTVGDGDRLAQVVSNLLDNGIAHTSAGGQVIVAARSREDGELEITVTDDGEGIPPGELNRIFERFYQVDKSRQRSRGAGLGLAITKEIVEAHGGSITAESLVGLGTRFTVRLRRTA